MSIRIGHSAKAYQERRSLLRNTRRGPGPVLNLADNLVHAYPVEPPLPLPELQHLAPGQAPPDCGHTQIWPHGLVDLE